MNTPESVRAPETVADLVAAEDVLLFVNAAITATGQREFRSGAADQQLSLDFLHTYVSINYRRVYAASLALDINHHNAALIVRRLLETAGEASAEERRTEGRLIAARLALLPPPRVYRLFGELRLGKVNNRRTRAIMRDWLAARPDLGHDAVKYRAGLKTAARHIHLPCPEGAEPLAEVGAFLFRPGRLPRYEHGMLDAWRRAHYEQGAVAELPFTVAEGFAAKHGMKREVFLQRAAPRMTRLERLRTQEQRAAVRRPGAPAAEVDLTVMPLTRLALYVLSLGFEQRAERRAELTGALRAAARRAAGGHAGSWGGCMRCWTTASPRPVRGRSGGGRSPWRWPATTCWRCSPRPARTGGCGLRARATRCSYARGGRPRWGCGSWTRWSRVPAARPRTGW